MRSIRYLLTGRPRKIDDALDLARTQHPTEVLLDLAAEQFPTDQTVLVELVAKYLWRFPTGPVRCEEVCGGFSILDDLETRSRQVAWANARLQRCVRRIGACRIRVIGSGKSFEDPGFMHRRTRR